MNLSGLPWHQLDRSAYVDVLQMVAAGKPAIRIRSVRPSVDLRDQLLAWAEANELDVASDDLYTCVAAATGAAARTLVVDSSSEPHALQLGVALGYPTCCAAAVAAVGEQHIDELGESVRHWAFSGRFRLIDPSGYSDGHALISHIPCTPTCSASLALADMARDWILAAETSADIEPWNTWARIAAIPSE